MIKIVLLAVIFVIWELVIPELVYRLVEAILNYDGQTILTPPFVKGYYKFSKLMTKLLFEPIVVGIMYIFDFWNSLGYSKLNDIIQMAIKAN